MILNSLFDHVLFRLATIAFRLATIASRIDRRLQRRSELRAIASGYRKGMLSAATMHEQRMLDLNVLRDVDPLEDPWRYQSALKRLEQCANLQASR